MDKRAIEWFLDMMSAEKGAAENTLSAYRSDLKQFFEICEIEAEDITRKHISDYIQTIGDKAYTPKTQARKLSTLREFCRFLYSEKILNDNPTTEITAPKQEKKLPNFLTEKEIGILLAAAYNHTDLSFKRIGIMISLMFATGLRVSEAISLPENAINYDRLQITVKGKGNKERIVPIAKPYADMIRDYANTYRQYFIAKKKKSNLLFPSKSSASGHITRDMFFKQIKQLAIECGLNTSRISPHTLRHSFASNLINHNADLRSVQKMLGHENISTTEIYTHIISQKLVDVVENNHPLQNLRLQ